MVDGSRQDSLDFERYRGRLEAIAYRLLGSASDAEDMVQETYIRWEAADYAAVRVPEAWLTKVLTNLCLTELSTARARRERYVGVWLPEPLPDGDQMLGPADSVEQREAVAMGVLHLLERLRPLERAVFVLREAFGHPHASVAEILDITETASQQTLHRARARLADAPQRKDVDPSVVRKVTTELVAAAAGGSLDDLLEVLADDVVAIGDGGGRIPARRVPVHGAVAVANLLRGFWRPSEAKVALVGGRPRLWMSAANGHPALVASVGGRVVAVLVPEVRDGKVVALLTQVNPRKLERFGQRWPTTDLGDSLGRW